MASNEAHHTWALTITFLVILVLAAMVGGKNGLFGVLAIAACLAFVFSL